MHIRLYTRLYIYRHAHKIGVDKKNRTDRGSPCGKHGYNLVQDFLHARGIPNKYGMGQGNVCCWKSTVMVTICFSPRVFTSCLTKKQASILPNIQENIITHEVGIPIHHFFHSFSPLLMSFSHFGPKITIAGEVQLREFQDFQTTFGRPDANGAIFWCLFRDDLWENSKLQEGNE